MMLRSVVNIDETDQGKGEYFEVLLFSSLIRSRSNSRRFGRAEITPARGPSQAGCASRIWVGGLPSDVREVELEDRFGKIGEQVFLSGVGGRLLISGRVTDVKICQSSRDTYAFLQFDTEGAAAEAIEDVDQTKFGGFTIKVEARRFVESL